MNPYTIINPEITRDEYTDSIYDGILNKLINPDCKIDLLACINRAVELEERPVFLEGVAERLNQLGISCASDDSEQMLSEVERRYKEILGKSCPRAVQNWFKGITPGVTHRHNHYDLCYALEMDFTQTAVFFQKHFLTVPFNVKEVEDAVYMYTLYHKKPYSAVTKLIDNFKGFVPQGNVHTSTTQIISTILEIENDEEFFRYLSEHCYSDEQQFQKARDIICIQIEQIKKRIQPGYDENDKPNSRLNSKIIDKLLNYRYQSDTKGEFSYNLPERFTESIPNDTTLGQIINGKKVSYELLRKTLMLLVFSNYYDMAVSEDEKHNHVPDKSEIVRRLMDFAEYLNSKLGECGFVRVYECHPFDCLLLYCANSQDPILTFHAIIERN